MVLLLELGDAVVEVGDDWINVFKIVLLECVELSDSSKELNKLTNTATEEFKLAENLVWREIELFGLWHGFKSLFSELILFDVCLL